MCAKNYPQIQKLQRNLQQVLLGSIEMPTELRSWFEDCWKRTILHYTWWRRSRIKEKSMSRVYVASRLESIPSKRVVFLKIQKRPGLGCEGCELSSSKSLRCGNHDRISVSSGKSFLSSNYVRNRQIRDRNDTNHSCYWKKRMDINPGRLHKDCFTE